MGSSWTSFGTLKSVLVGNESKFKKAYADITFKQFYKEALKQGVKPQDARRIIPQAAYTQIWGAFQPKQLENYFKLRLDESSQWEIRIVSKAMQELINGRK